MNVSCFLEIPTQSEKRGPGKNILAVSDHTVQAGPKDLVGDLLQSRPLMRPFRFKAMIIFHSQVTTLFFTRWAQIQFEKSAFDSYVFLSAPLKADRRKAEKN
eukprot:g66244.t1